MSDPVVRTSKFLSLVLRHQPEKIGLELDEGGWAKIDDLLAKLAEHGVPVSRSDLDHVVVTNNKRRFAISADGRRIRANQGHSVAVELGLDPRKPPDVLYHGSAESNETSIVETGLDKRARQHVHLSSDHQTAVMVGARHGKPIVFRVHAAEMYSDGHLFFQSENGVWLTEQVPPRYLSVLRKRA